MVLSNLGFKMMLGYHYLNFIRNSFDDTYFSISICSDPPNNRDYLRFGFLFIHDRNLLHNGGRNSDHPTSLFISDTVYVFDIVASSGLWTNTIVISVTKMAPMFVACNLTNPQHNHYYQYSFHRSIHLFVCYL